jgi:hypothetical protein
MSACRACGTQVSATARFCRMCGHRLAVPEEFTAKSDVSAGNGPIAQADAYDDSVTLSFVSDTPSAPFEAGSAAGGGARTAASATDAVTAPACEICGKTAGEGEALCNACARLVAPSERDDG